MVLAALDLAARVQRLVLRRGRRPAAFLHEDVLDAVPIVSPPAGFVHIEMHEGGDIPRPRRASYGALQGRQQLGRRVDRLDDAMHGLALQAAVLFEEVIAVGKLFHRHQRLDLPLAEGRVQREDAPHVEKKGEELVLGKGIGDLGRHVVVVEGEHLHGFVARHEIGHAVCDELGIEEEIGKRRAGAGAADERIQFAVNFIKRLFGDGAHDEFHFGEGSFRSLDALLRALGKKGDLPGERKNAQPLDLGKIIEKEGGIFAARIEEGDVKAGALGGSDLLDEGQNASEPLRLFLRPAHGAAPLPVKFDAGQNKVVGAARRTEARLVKAPGDAPKLSFLHDGIPQKRT